MRMLQCYNVARRWSNETTAQTTKEMLHDVARKFDVNQTLSNIVQHRATGWSNGATCCVQQCCTMLHEMLHPFDRGLRYMYSLLTFYHYFTFASPKLLPSRSERLRSAEVHYPHPTLVSRSLDVGSSGL